MVTKPIFLPNPFLCHLECTTLIPTTYEWTEGEGCFSIKCNLMLALKKQKERKRGKDKIW